MDAAAAKERLLEAGSTTSSDGQDSQQYLHGYRPSRLEEWSRVSVTLTLLFCLLLSFIANVVFSTRLHGPSKAGSSTCSSRYSGLGFDVGVPYHSQSDYWSDNQTLADSLWESIDTSPMVVALPYTEAFGRGLSWSVPWVWDDDKGVYLIKAFHSVHCLVRTYLDLACEVGTAFPFPELTWCDAQKLVRKAVHDYAYGRPNPVHMFHVNHCLDSLRQDLMCKADDTPMPSINQPHKTGDGQIMECRDWDKLVAWARRSDHHSCFEHINEYEDPVHKLEQFAFCPEDHPSREVMTAYFEKFGHKDAFAA